MRRAALLGFAILAALLTGCGNTTNATSTPASTGTGSMCVRGQMTMAPGQSMSGMGQSTCGAAPHMASDVAAPSPSARLICSSEIERDIGHAAGLSSAVRGSSTWQHHLYTCVYRLPEGKLVLDVKEPADAKASRHYFTSLRTTLAPTTRLKGLAALGLPSYETSSGIVVFDKDGQILRVDATRLTGGIGPHKLSPSSFAYEVASDVIGCWSE